MTPTHPFNGTLTHDPKQGYIWKTNCTGCRTEQHIRLGSASLEKARQAVDIIDRTPQECPAGFHTELSGWRYYWSLDLMLERYAAELESLFVTSSVN